MPPTSNSMPLKALPTQFVAIDNGVLLKRGCTEFTISGGGAQEILQLVWAISHSQALTRDELCEQFAPGYRSNLEQLIDQLISRRFLVDSNTDLEESNDKETSLDIFYWEFGSSAQRVTSLMNTKRFAILGINYISRQLISSLKESGVTNFQIVDHPLLRNLRLFDSRGHLLKTYNLTDNFSPILSLQDWEKEKDANLPDCLIATSDFGGREIMREWNKFCVEHNRHFMPAILQNLIGKVGPFVIPGETACFECLLSRENSNLENPTSYWEADNYAFEGQNTIGFHPAMASILGDLVALELTKFYSGVLPRWNVGTLLEVKMLATQLESRKVLKVPRCIICSPLKQRASSNNCQKKTFLANHFAS